MNQRSSDPVMLALETHVELTAKSNEELVDLAIKHCMPLIDTGKNVPAMQLMLEMFHRLNPKFGT